MGKGLGNWESGRAYYEMTRHHPATMVQRRRTSDPQRPWVFHPKVGSLDFPFFRYPVGPSTSRAAANGQQKMSRQLARIAK